MRLTLLLLGALLLASIPARADEPPRPRPPRLGLDLSYTLKPEAARCPSKQVMKDLLIGEFAYNPHDMERAEVRVGVSITMTRRKGVYYGEITITQADGKVLWSGEDYDPDCLEALRYVSLEIGVRMDLLFPAPTPAPPPPPATPPPAAPPPPAPPPARSTPAPPPGPSPLSNAWGVRGGLGGEVNYGLLPGVGAGGQAFVTVYRPGFSISGEFRMLASIVPSISERGEVVRGRFLGGAIVPCAQDVLRGVSWGLALCGALDLGWLSFGPEDHPLYAPAGLAVTLGVRPAVEWTLGSRFALHGFLEIDGILRGPLGRRDYRDVGWQPSPVGVSGSAAVSLRLP